MNTPVREPTGPFQGARILVIEDEFLIATVIEDLLRRAGAREVIVAMSASEAFATLGDVQPLDGAVIDIQLNDGTDAGYALAETALKRNIPFVFLTAYSPERRLPDPFSTVPLLTKPYVPETLVQVLGDAMQRARGAPR